MGSMTGRGMGFCSGGMGRATGRFGKRGQGFGGRGRQKMYHATGLTGWQRAEASVQPPVAAEAELQEHMTTLQQRVYALSQSLAQINQRIAELQKNQNETPNVAGDQQ